MRDDTPIVVDFETLAIEPRPAYPPHPVGVAIMYPGLKPKYLAFGHPTANNSTKAKVREELEQIWKYHPNPILFHNAKFDLDVAEKHFGLKPPSWELIHDTLFQAFLAAPHALSLSLKPLAEQFLGLPPEERDEVAAWLRERQIITKAQHPGAFISQAPGDVVGRYAIGDVVRTWKLHQHFYKKVICRDRNEAGGQTLLDAYNRERRLLLPLLQNEREGVPVNVERLERDLPIYETALTKVEKWLNARLHCEINFDSDADVAAALKQAGVVSSFVKTKTGRDSVAKKNLTPDKFTDPKVAAALGYRNRLVTVLSMSMRPWLEQAQANDGRIFTEWNQVRQSHGNDGAKGTRTGRLSCSRLMNITKDFTDKGDGYVHPGFGLPELPLVRQYIIADPGSLFVHRDYSQQEFRILAHFEDDVLMRAYLENPRLDKHKELQKRLAELGHVLERRPVKILGFGRLYGMGAGRFAESLKMPVDEVRRLLFLMKQAEPGVTRLDESLKDRGRRGIPIRTWGGRLYHREEPKMIKEGPRHGEMQTFEYKLLNYLIQGSAADCTKEAIIRYNEARGNSRLLVTVHDEINISVPKKSLKREMEILRQAMEGVEFDVPMLTDAEIGTSWGELKEYDEDPKRSVA